MTTIINCHLQRRFNILGVTPQGYVRLIACTPRVDKNGQNIPEGEVWVEQETYNAFVQNGRYIEVEQ